ncbi:allergen Asp f 7 homolog [Helianthus annuus]|uniref:allergen Asp f 7 homolog n=1 Tax=Helianthus annuus TaxID=4232 RepID=UPI000B8F0591|nr:allergen Asp f 7 homolog [Helianthus annuus]
MEIVRKRLISGEGCSISGDFHPPPVQMPFASLPNSNPFDPAVSSTAPPPPSETSMSTPPPPETNMTPPEPPESYQTPPPSTLPDNPSPVTVTPQAVMVSPGPTNG